VVAQGLAVVAMKCLPLWQPWASLVAIEAKRIETRHWRAPARLIGQRIAIHATKTKRELGICTLEPFLTRLAAGGIERLEDLPLGAIVCTAVLDRCSPMTWESIGVLIARDPDEHAFGHYEPGRFAWVLRGVERLAVPVPFVGRQGIFDVPDELLGLPLAPRHEQGALL
jgi:hypothetical protein